MRVGGETNANIFLFFLTELFLLLVLLQTNSCHADGKLQAQYRALCRTFLGHVVDRDDVLLPHLREWPAFPSRVFRGCGWG